MSDVNLIVSPKTGVSVVMTVPKNKININVPNYNTSIVLKPHYNLSFKAPKTVVNLKMDISKSTDSDIVIGDPVILAITSINRDTNELIEDITYSNLDVISVTRDLNGLIATRSETGQKTVNIIRDINGRIKSTTLT